MKLNLLLSSSDFIGIFIAIMVDYVVMEEQQLYIKTVLGLRKSPSGAS